MVSRIIVAIKRLNADASLRFKGIYRRGSADMKGAEIPRLHRRRFRLDYADPPNFLATSDVLEDLLKDWISRQLIRGYELQHVE